jgi:hypothetical protein
MSFLATILGREYASKRLSTRATPSAAAEVAADSDEEDADEERRTSNAPAFTSFIDTLTVLAPLTRISESREPHEQATARQLDSTMAVDPEPGPCST